MNGQKHSLKPKTSNTKDDFHIQKEYEIHNIIPDIQENTIVNGIIPYERSIKTTKYSKNNFLKEFTEDATECTTCNTGCTEGATGCTEGATGCTTCNTGCTEGATGCTEGATGCTTCNTGCTEGTIECTTCNTGCTEDTCDTCGICGTFCKGATGYKGATRYTEGTGATGYTEGTTYTSDTTYTGNTGCTENTIGCNDVTYTKGTEGTESTTYIKGSKSATFAEDFTYIDVTGAKSAKSSKSSIKYAMGTEEVDTKGVTGAKNVTNKCVMGIEVDTKGVTDAKSVTSKCATSTEVDTKDSTSTKGATSTEVNTKDSTSTKGATSTEVDTKDSTSTEYVFDYVLIPIINNLNISIPLKSILITLVRNIDIITDRTMSNDFYITLKHTVETGERQTNSLIDTITLMSERMGEQVHSLSRNDIKLDTKIELMNREFKSININFKNIGDDIIDLKGDIADLKDQFQINIDTIMDVVDVKGNLHNLVKMKKYDDDIHKLKEENEKLKIQLEKQYNSFKKENNKLKTRLEKHIEHFEEENKYLKTQLNEYRKDMEHLNAMMKAMQRDNFPGMISEENSHKIKSSDHFRTPDRSSKDYFRNSDRFRSSDDHFRKSRSSKTQFKRHSSRSPKRQLRQSGEKPFEEYSEPLFNKVHNDDSMTLFDFDNKIPYQTPSSTNGSLIMWLTDFSDCINNAKHGINETIFSRSFYSDICGYKMCMRINPNGDRNGYGNYVSVFFIIMKGDYDDELEWPFKMKVTFELFNSGSVSIVKSAFIPDGGSSFTKPTQKQNIPYGLPLFVNHSKVYKVLEETGDNLCIYLTVNDSRKKSSNTFSFN